MPTEFSFIIHATYAKDQLAADVMVTLISQQGAQFPVYGALSCDFSKSQLAAGCPAHGALIAHQGAR
jgi:hypothetical protein